MTSEARQADSARHPRDRLATTAIVLEILLGVGAIGGGLALMVGPNGEILPLPVSALAGSPFANYFVPGAILFTIIGLGPLGAALLARRRHPLAPLAAFAIGVALLVWLGVEIAIIGYASKPPLQALYLAHGVAMVLVGGAWMRYTRAQRLAGTCRSPKLHCAGADGVMTRKTGCPPRLAKGKNTR